jgi:hypothetical protein
LITLHPARSPNGQYYIVKATEQIAGSVVFHWFYSIDKGKTWTKYSTTRNQGSATTQTEEMGGTSAQYNNPNNTIVANNGKWFSIYNNYDGSRTSVKGMYGDISVGSPTISDTPGIANGAENFNQVYSTVAGYIFSRTGTEESTAIHVTGDLVDLSFVAALGQLDANNAIMVQQFTSGGATAGVRNSMAAGASSYANCLVKALCSGTTPNHRLSMFLFTTGSSGTWRYFDEGVSGGAVTAVDPLPSPNNSAGAIGGAVTRTTHKGYGLHKSGVAGYSSFTNSSTPGFIGRTLHFAVPEDYNGFSATGNIPYLRTSAHRVVIDPANDNHVFSHGNI